MKAYVVPAALFDALKTYLGKAPVEQLFLVWPTIVGLRPVDVPDPPQPERPAETDLPAV